MADRQPIVATFVLIPRIEIVELLAQAGFDAVILDLEHGPYGIGDLAPLIAAGHGAGVYSIVRVPEVRAHEIGLASDIGADGILVPHVDGPAAARELVTAGRFPPDGDRSLNPFVRGAGYDAGPTFLPDDNARIALLGMVEGREALTNLAEILAVPGLDAAFVGPMDLSAAVGFPGEPEHPHVIEKVRDIVRAALDVGIAIGIYSPTTDAASRWLSMGAGLVAVTADAHMALEGFRSYRSAV